MSGKFAKKDPTSFINYINDNPKAQEKLIKFIIEGKSGTLYLDKNHSKYINKEMLEQLKEIYNTNKNNKKEGGFLPLLLAAIPAIVKGIAVGTAVAGGAAGIAQAVNTAKSNQKRNEEQKRHNKAIEDSLKINKSGGNIGEGGATASAGATNKRSEVGGRRPTTIDERQRGNGIKEDIKEGIKSFVQENELDETIKKLVKKTLKGLSGVIPMRKEGGSLILSPYKVGGALATTAERRQELRGASLVLKDWN